MAAVAAGRRGCAWSPPTARHLGELPAGEEGASATIPDGDDGRVAVLAERADPRWQATLDGSRRRRPTLVDGWAQGFVLPTEGGRLVITYDGTERTRWLAVQAGAGRPGGPARHCPARGGRS